MADNEIVEVALAVKQALAEKGHRADLVEVNPDNLDDLCQYSCIFNLAETIYGFPLTDYEIARRLEELHLPFTGSGSATLKICLDKPATKRELVCDGIRTPAFEVFQPGQPIRNRLPYPLFVKPVHEDASVGIDKNAIVNNRNELAHQIQIIHERYKQAALVEQYIHGRDITAAILGNGSAATVLPLSEIEYLERDDLEFLTFDAKWVNDSRDYQLSPARCPCSLTPQQEAVINDIALRTYFALGCRDYARVDFRLHGDTPYVLEVNPNPCLNPRDAGFVRSGKAAGYSYVELVNQILESVIQGQLESPDAESLE